MQKLMLNFQGNSVLINVIRLTSNSLEFQNHKVRQDFPVFYNTSLQISPKSNGILNFSSRIIEKPLETVAARMWLICHDST